jgi:hypothetical protein
VSDHRDYGDETDVPPKYSWITPEDRKFLQELRAIWIFENKITEADVRFLHALRIAVE